MLRNLLFTIMILVAPVNLWAKECYQQDLENAFQLREEGKLQEALVQFQALSKAHPKKTVYSLRPCERAGIVRQLR